MLRDSGKGMHLHAFEAHFRERLERQGNPPSLLTLPFNTGHSQSQ